MILYYIGPGKNETGDWCFSDGFISFREIMDIYMTNQHFKEKLLTIISDCSYSGSWIRDSMAFLDEQGVGPCGHAAKEKGIFVKLFTSCQANEIPTELAFSTYSSKNDKKIGWISAVEVWFKEEIHDDQHPTGMDYTWVQCKNEISQPCTMAPGSTWEQWSTADRIKLVKGESRGFAAWHYIKLRDNEDTQKAFDEKTATGSIDVALYGEVLKSGWGIDPPDNIVKEIEGKYKVNYSYTVL